MSGSITGPVDQRSEIQKNPRLSDDDPIAKAQAVPTPSNPNPVERGWGEGSTHKKVSK